MKAFATNILNDVITSNPDLYPLHVEYEKLLLWVQRVVYKKLGLYRSDVELMKQYYVVKTFVHDVLQQRVKQLYVTR